MSLAGQIARYDALRSLAFGGISGSYAGVGGSFAHPVRQLTIDNFTDADLMVSFNGITDNTVIHADSSKIIDIALNRVGPVDQLDQPIGDRVYVKQISSAATVKAVYVTVIYASTT